MNDWPQTFMFVVAVDRDCDALILDRPKLVEGYICWRLGDFGYWNVRNLPTDPGVYRCTMAWEKSISYGAVFSVISEETMLDWIPL